MLKSLIKRLFFGATASPTLLSGEVTRQFASSRKAFDEAVSRYGVPRIAVVKQDINEDLYCCPSGSQGRPVIDSTLLRSGQVALFSEWNAKFLLVESVDDPECTIWDERATKLHWDTLEFFRSYQDKIPGRNYGQRSLAQSVDSIDWNQFDIVVSIDCSVPARVTRKFANTLWCYYVREIKTPEYHASLTRPLPGQDLVFSHHFRPAPPPLAPHVLDFPYHLHRYGCLQSVFGEELVPDNQRHGIFVDHHTMTFLSPEQRTAFHQFGPIASTIHDGPREVIPTSEKLARRTLDPDLRERLFRSRYFLCTQGKRPAFGTAIVEAIAAGCLMIASPDRIGCPFLASEATSARSVEETLECIALLESNDELRCSELQRQRELIDWLCFYRPLTQLLERRAQKSKQAKTSQVKS